MVAPLASVGRFSRPDIAPFAVGALAAGTLVATANSDDGVLLCPFRRCTGGYCPGCGVTRAANRLVHGDLQASWSQHPWVLFALVQLVALGAAAAFVQPAVRAERLRRAVVPLLLLNTIMLIGIWVVRRSADVIPVGWL